MQFLFFCKIGSTVGIIKSYGYLKLINIVVVVLHKDSKMFPKIKGVLIHKAG